MRNQIIWENVKENLKKLENLEEDGYNDTGRIVIEYEKGVFFSGNDLFSNCSIKRIGNEINIEIKDSKDEIWLRGDNLITRKQMYKMLCGKPKEPVDNDHHLYSFIVLPYIRKEGMGRNQLNSKRATVAGYYDNPFVFLDTLEKCFNKQFNDMDNKDGVEELILHEDNIKFWALFKSDDGFNFKEYLKTFCLEFYWDWDLKEKEEYKKFFGKEGEKNRWEQGDWDTYNELLTEFGNRRKDEFVKRIEKIINE
jgi:hypothetical protein